MVLFSLTMTNHCYGSWTVTCNSDFNIEAFLANHVLDSNGIDASVRPLRCRN